MVTGVWCCSLFLNVAFLHPKFTEPCFITRAIAYTHERAHWVFNKENREEVVSGREILRARAC